MPDHSKKRQTKNYLGRTIKAEWKVEPRWKPFQPFSTPRLVGTPSGEFDGFGLFQQVKGHTSGEIARSAQSQAQFQVSMS